MSIAENIRRLRTDASLTQASLADKLGVTRATVTQWETGWSQPRMGMVEKLAKVFRVPLSDIVDEEQGAARKTVRSIPVQGMEMGYVPLRGKVHAGKPVEADVYEDEMVMIPQFLIEQDPECWASRSEGDCMNNVYPEGCVYVISPSKPHQNGRPEVWTIDDVDTVARRVYKTADTLLLSPDSTNPENKDIVIKADDGHHAKYDGAIVWFQSDGEVE